MNEFFFLFHSALEMKLKKKQHKEITSNVDKFNISSVKDLREVLSLKRTRWKEMFKWVIADHSHGWYFMYSVSLDLIEHRVENWNIRK